MNPLSPNTLLQNRYLIVHLIGKGGMGEVYLAVDQRLGSAIALKRTFFKSDEMLGHAFEREARTLARLRHPALPKVSDHFIENENQYLVMEHISGDDLAKRLSEMKKPFPLNWVLFWADELLEALTYLHSHEPPIIHRDIKPQNLKLTAENRIILLDFGLAKNNNVPTQTTGGSIVGYSRHYAPMEQIRGTGTDPRSDVYSLSATLYQLLTNIVPLDALTRAESILNNLPDPLEPLRTVNPEVPDAISNVLMKGMNLSADQRFATAREMQTALREAYREAQAATGVQTVAYPAQGAESSAPSAPSGALLTPSVSDAQPTSNPTYAEEPSTAVMADAKSSARSNVATEAMHVSSPPEKKTESVPIEGRAEPAGLQSQQKTEVMPAELLGELGYTETKSEPELLKAEQGAAGSSFSSGSAAADPSATVPLISLGDSPSIGAAGSETSDAKSDSVPTVIPGTSTPASRNVVAASQPAVRAATQTKKKSSGMALAVIGGLGVLGLLAAGAAVVGWYALSGGSSSEPSMTTSPSPRVEATPEPRLEPSPEVYSSVNSGTMDSNTSIGAEASNANLETSNTADDAAKRDAKTPDRSRAAEKTPSKTSAPTSARANSRTVTAATPGKTVSTKTPAPTKSPKKGSRTDILQ